MANRTVPAAEQASPPRLAFGILLALCAACGGGGGNGGGPGPPDPIDLPGAAALALEIDLKTLRFSWDAVDGATRYRLLANPDGASGFTQVGDDIPAGGTSVDLDVPVHLHDWADARYLLDACNDGGCTGSNEVGTIDGALAAIGYFKNSNHEAGDSAGAVAISADGMTLAVGAEGEDSAATGIDGNQADNSASDAGAVYVYRRIDGQWSQQAYLKATNTEVGDRFGLSIALSADGTTLAVGAPLEDSAAVGIGGDQLDNSGVAAGAVYVFVNDDAATWSQQAYVKASNTGAADIFGFAIALSGDGNTLAVGASREDSAATGIGGDQDDDSASNAGAVYVFRRNAAEVWAQSAYVKATNTEAGDIFGSSLALDDDGDTLAVGATGEDSAAVGIDGNASDNSATDSGAVYVYASGDAGEDWQPQSYGKAPNSENSDFFHTVALSADGNTLAVGASREDSAAIGVDGAQDDNSAIEAGAAYVYGRSGSEWSYRTYLKASNPEAGDLFGFSVAVSGDGNTIALGAALEDGVSTGIDGDQADNGADGAGAVYVFRRAGNSEPWSQRAYLKASNPDGNDLFGVSLALSADGATLAVVSSQEAGGVTGIGGNQNDDTAPFAGAVYLY
ncbi:MAG: FG-GAP repeat protein [Steroidobacteraceae bacterium]